jgi:hypothetical protein
MTRAQEDPAPRPVSPAVPVGEWRLPDGDWTRRVILACRLCGKPLCGRVWSAEFDGVRADFCDPDCESLLHDYWLPRHGSAASANS